MTRFHGDIMSKVEYKEIVRMLDTDIKGSVPIVEGLTRIKGIGPTLSRAILRKLGIPLNKRVGFLSNEEIDQLENIIKNVNKIFPPYMLNRRFDRYSGENLHLIGSDIDFVVERDIDFEKKINSWRGLRHRLGLKVRGQRTRTTGRKRGFTVGVKRKKR